MNIAFSPSGPVSRGGDSLNSLNRKFGYNAIGLAAYSEEQQSGFRLTSVGNTGSVPCLSIGETEESLVSCH